MSLLTLHQALTVGDEGRVELSSQDQVRWRSQEVRREPGFVVVLGAPGEFRVWAEVGDVRCELRDVYRRGSGFALHGLESGT